MRGKEARPSLKITPLDLRSVTREGAEAFLYVDTADYSDNGPMRQWIHCGRIKLQGPDRRGYRPWILSARAREGVTDLEHDSAYIFQIPVVGVELEFIENGWTYLSGWIGGEPDDLRVPTKPDYDPAKLPGAEICEDCEYRDESEGKSHPIVPEGYWAGPPASRKIWEQLVGRKLEIRLGPPLKKEDQEEEE